MTTASCGRCRWRTLAASGVLGWLLRPDAIAAIAPPDEPSLQAASAQDEALYLEVVLNRVMLPDVYPFTLRGGRLWATPATLRGIGLRTRATGEGGLVALAALPGATADYDVAEQRLTLQVPVDLLAAPPARLGYAPPAPPSRTPESRVPGLLLDYDLYGEGASGYQRLSAWSELRLFGVGGGLWRTSALSRWGHDAGGHERAGIVRLDSSFVFDYPEQMVRVAVGDTFTGGLGWTRTSRLGGVQVSRNFGLQPYRVTMPLARFAGEAVLPSTADLFIEGVRQPRVAVAPGRFEMQNVPILSGAGTAQVVLTDITGHQQTLSFSFYTSPELLQRGLADWSVEAGYLRRDYALDSFSYARDPFVSGSVRVGASDAVTLEAHLESSAQVSMAGAGAVFLVPGVGGTAHGHYARSRHAGRAGTQYGFGYQWQGPRFHASYTRLRRDAAFRDVASLGTAPLSRRTEQAFLGVSAGRAQLGASYVREDLPVFGDVRYAGLSASMKLRRWGSVSLNLGRDLEKTDGVDAYLYWTASFGERAHAWASAERSGGRASASVGAARSLPGDENGFGWRVQASTGEQAGWQGELSQLASAGQWRAGVLGWRSDDARSTTAYADASGALLLMQGQLFAMRRVYDAFALVSTDGIAGVPVMLENRPVGHTDAHGYLLVTPLNAWQRNDLSIEPRAVPADVTLSRTRMDAVPSTGSGVLARFPMKRVLAVAFALRAEDGSAIAAGTPIRIGQGTAAREAVVGYDGAVFVEDPAAGAQVVVPLEDGACVATLPQGLPSAGWRDLGVLPCVRP